MEVHDRKDVTRCSTGRMIPKYTARRTWESMAATGLCCPGSCFERSLLALWGSSKAPVLLRHLLQVCFVIL